ncbi:recombinase RecT [Vibrio mediterranei]|uniref:recombinase RecT n=1 Tax=Vibrio mediterranei TaxID=689 RepID=UPI001798905F|nr:recombinase RecT [Vibrio mediterranei]NUW71391.1 recombinase RecT [Vibrio mediterranei]
MNQLTVSSINNDLMPAIVNEGIEAILPSHIKVETFVKSAAIAIFNNSSLIKADRNSVISSLILAAKDGLVCDGREAALVPYSTKTNGGFIQKAQYMPMVDGVLKRARQSGQIKMIMAKPIFESDHFDYYADENGEHFKYVPAMTQRGNLQRVFAAAMMTNGELQIEVLTLEDIERSRAHSKTGNNENGAWKNFYDRMAVKTALHRLARRLPNSSELIEMLERGDPKLWDNTEDRKVMRPENIKKETAAQVDSLMGESASKSEVIEEAEVTSETTSSTADMSSLMGGGAVEAQSKYQQWHDLVLSSTTTNEVSEYMGQAREDANNGLLSHQEWEKLYAAASGKHRSIVNSTRGQ